MTVLMTEGAWDDLMARWAPYQTQHAHFALAYLVITHFAKITNLTRACSVIIQIARSTNFTPDYTFFTILLSL